MTLPHAERMGVAGLVRIALRSAAILGVFAVCAVLYPLGHLIARRNPVSRIFLRAVLRIAGTRLTVTGDRVRPPSILLANHVSWLDILALTSATGTVFVAHDGLASHPALRLLLRLHHTVLIARSERASVTGQVDQVRKGLSDNGVLTLFPEGTTGNGRDLAVFKSSLLAAAESGEAGVAVRPVWIDYGPQTADIAWFGEEAGAVNVKRILARKDRIAITVHLLPPLGDADKASRKTIALAARKAILEQMDQRVAL